MQKNSTHLVNADFCTLPTALSISAVRFEFIQELTQVFGQRFICMSPHLPFSFLRQELLHKPHIFFHDPLDERLGEIAVHEEG